ncbi:exodeoxyribonuclease III [Desulfurella sp.]|uniref:exodeoxyribonuclease III n=1 Tax=Desulfurella sp. TaxID=1962857 RepID=UPI0025C19DE7|nr:exodeoxyribonuclease III [Desulfurella sp.]
MRIATWNVNSIRVRLDKILDWITQKNIDVIAMQEIKAPDDKFPYNNFKDLGYNVESFGEVGFNGVAIASKFPMENVKKGFALDARAQKRMISCEINSIKIINVYIPNGKQVGTGDYYYKLDYLSKLKEYLISLMKDTKQIILMGDLNVALSDLDVYNSSQMSDQIGFTHSEKNALQDILNIGFFDVCREFYKDKKLFSFWDYRANSFLRNKGMRVDYILTTKEIFEKVVFCDIDEKERAKPGASDHAPVYAKVNINTGGVS